VWLICDHHLRRCGGHMLEGTTLTSCDASLVCEDDNNARNKKRNKIVREEMALYDRSNPFPFGK